MPLVYQRLNFGTNSGDLGIYTDANVRVSLQGYAWCALDNLALWTILATRGQNLRIPHAPGTRAKRRRVDEARYDVLLAMTGECDANGNPATYPFWEQLEINVAYLDDNLATPPASTAKRLADLIMPSGATRQAYVQVEQIRLGQHIRADLVAATMPLIVTTGRFV